MAREGALARRHDEVFTSRSFAACRAIRRSPRAVRPVRRPKHSPDTSVPQCLYTQPGFRVRKLCGMRCNRAILPLSARRPARRPRLTHSMGAPALSVCTGKAPHPTPRIFIMSLHDPVTTHHQRTVWREGHVLHQSRVTRQHCRMLLHRHIQHTDGLVVQSEQRILLSG